MTVNLAVISYTLRWERKICRTTFEDLPNYILCVIIITKWFSAAEMYNFDPWT